MRGRMMKPWVVMPRVTVTRYQTSLVSSASTDFMCRISPAIRNATPRGARCTTQLVSRIITCDTDLKNISRGLPSSPDKAETKVK